MDKEKKVIKIQLSTLIIVIVLVIIAIIVAISFYAKSIGKPNLISSIESLVKKEPVENVNETRKTNR